MNKCGTGTGMWRRKVKLKARLKSSSANVSFKR